MFYLFWPLVLLSSAQADQALERLCFPSVQEAQRAIPIVNVVLVKGQDSVQPDGQCLDVHVDSKRGEIFQRWVKTRLPLAQSQFSTLNAPTHECNMLALKKTRKAQQNNDIKVNDRAFQISAGDNSSEQKEEHILKVTSGETATLRMDTTELQITCTYRSDNNYLLKFVQTYVPRPLPPVPLGSPVIVMPSSQDAGTSASTTVEIHRGQTINIGEISKDLSNKQKNIGVPEGVVLENTTGEQTTEWSLTLR